MPSKRASNIEVKKINRNRIFRYVNKYERVSRPDIASALGISTPTVLQNINELLLEGLVLEVGEFQSTGGRKATAIAPVQDVFYAIGIDITQNHVGLVLTNLSGEILRHKRVSKIYRNKRDYYKEMADIAKTFLAEGAGTDFNIGGVGISIPGIINLLSNKIIYSHALNITNVDCSVFTEFIPYPCTFINDANAAGIAEIYHIEDKFNAAYLSLSNYVGGAIIQEHDSFGEHDMINSLLYLGDNLRAGEFGHMTLVPGGNHCYCGKNGCVDTYCSAKVLARHADESLEKFFEELKDGNDSYAAIWEEYLNYLAIEVNNLRMVFDCRVIIGGYVGSFIEPYIARLREKAESRNTFETDGTYILPCRYKVEASALGAALQCVESFICKI